MQDKTKKLLIAGVGILSITFILGLKNSRASDHSDTFTDELQVLPKHNQLYGQWVSPIPGNDREIQGFVLNNDGTARSINMATLEYQLWHVHNDKLVLTAESIGNKTSSIGQDVYIIDSLTGSRLFLKHGETPIVYWRVKK